MRVAAIDPRRASAMLAYAGNKLEKHQNYPYVAQAPDAMARFLDRADIDDLHQYFRTLIAFHRSGHLGTGDVTMGDILTYNPADYEHDLYSEYQAIYAALKVLQEDLRQTRILQIACNYGPFQHLLREVEGSVFALGIDINEAAIQYAQQNRVQVQKASSSELPFPDENFDFLISRNFLDRRYLDAMIGRASTDAHVAATKHEIFRVLKPAGFFISGAEQLFRFEPRFTGLATVALPKDIPLEGEIFSDLRVFQKPA